MGTTLLDHLETVERVVRDLFGCISGLEQVDDQGLLDLTRELDALTFAADAVTDLTEAIEQTVLNADESDRIIGPITSRQLLDMFAVRT